MSSEIMWVTELIQNLQEFVNMYGDKQVYVWNPDIAYYSGVTGIEHEAKYHRDGPICELNISK